MTSSGWAAALKRVWTDAAYRAELADRGVRQAQQFTWQATSGQIARAYRDLLDHPLIMASGYIDHWSLA